MGLSDLNFGLSAIGVVIAWGPPIFLLIWFLGGDSEWKLKFDRWRWEKLTKEEQLFRFEKSHKKFAHQQAREERYPLLFKVMGLLAGVALISAFFSVTALWIWLLHYLFD